ncbi:hypothetical protein P5G51_004820 [Virgibacillus sp. 179-BFC.A HS]|uniref:LacI family transcriptional regulator n=1 Tax=Tigheibacillus jepli TaxID=3035914 RepID=A0ABU5CEP7_9BACI|nr:hypothetical protein [Virgibacillus sp. 179-BFC.A HS]MDY0404812.1 hypothetical protein [Virgibacillus sp. 179-BFC.A HS]
MHWYTEKEELNDLYYLSIRLGVEKRAKELGINQETYFMDELPEALPGIDGIIAIGKFSKAQIKSLTQFHSTIVFVDYNPGLGNEDVIMADLAKGVRDVLDYFLEKGHTNIGYIGGRECLQGETVPIDDKREMTFLSYMQEKTCSGGKICL